MIRLAFAAVCLLLAGTQGSWWLLAAGLVLAVLSCVHRSSSCRCGHDGWVHTHHTDRTHCGSCICPRFCPPFQWRFR